MKKVTKIAETASSKVKLKKIRVAAYCRVANDIICPWLHEVNNHADDMAWCAELPIDTGCPVADAAVQC